MDFWEDDEIDNSEAVAFAEEIIRARHIDQPTLGVSKLYVDKGLGALSTKQRGLLKATLFGEFARKNCERCGSEIPWSEKYAAYDNGGMCAYCQHMRDKAMDE